jgi:hypothetical protein
MRGCFPTFVLVVLVSIGGGCSGGAVVVGDAAAAPDAPLGTFDWCSTGPDNCWRTVLAAVDACGPSPGPDGVFDADALVCTYPDGATVTFDATALPPPEGGFDVVLERGGTRCARVVRVTSSSGSSTRIESTAGTLSYEVDNVARRASATCPDGRTYALTGTPSCGGDPDTWPFVTGGHGDAQSWGFTLGGGPSGAVTIFDCHRP